MPTPLEERGVLYTLPVPEAEHARAEADRLLRIRILPLEPVIGRERVNQLDNAVVTLGAATEMEIASRLVAVLSAITHGDVDVFVAPETDSEIPKLERTVGTDGPMPPAARPWRAHTSPWAWLTVSSTIAVAVSLRRSPTALGRALLVLPLLCNAYTGWLMRPGKKRGRLRRRRAT